MKELHNLFLDIGKDPLREIFIKITGPTTTIPVFAATFNQNGNGDMTSINWIKE